MDTSLLSVLWSCLVRRVGESTHGWVERGLSFGLL